MSFQRQFAFWLAAAALFALAIWVFRDILLPFVAGLVLAYLLDPLADRLQRLGMGRLLATLLILALFVMIFTVALLLLVPIVVTDLAAFLAKIPDYARQLQQLLARYGAPIAERFGGDLPDLQNSLGTFVSRGASWLGDLLTSLWSGGQALLGVVSLIVVTPVVAFYLLVDWDHMIATVDGWVPVRSRNTVRELAREINAAIAGFVRGQALVCLLLGTWYAVGLTLTGLNFGFLIGLLSGFLTFIPYVGSLTGLVLATGVAIVQFWPDPVMIGLVLAVFFSGQFLEGNILSPKLVGHAVGLHPVWLMFALFAFGNMLGFVGLLLAVPLAATVGVLARFSLRQYLASPLYAGGPVSSPGPESRS
ncbi:AI-2E family transporter [Alsobacter sp. SYSU M60028]|uniref:AI-2E family transporter n=1 Tax=Alsobacter ponti TaxID=2962936 RepID=A0ABT1LCZ7_9HYPH|nr:AI-2E family transporter [Alsobacter ponti]MCP8939367.1 AI-2E family transporter [Alsobacter ponti]